MRNFAFLFLILGVCTSVFGDGPSELWVARYNGPGNSSDSASALAKDNSGNVYVTGASGNDYATVKYAPDGNQLWVARYDGPLNKKDGAQAVVVDTSANVYVTGTCNSNYWPPTPPPMGGNYDYATIKYSPDGNQLWAALYNGTGDSSDRAFALAVDSSGNVYVTGWSTGSGTGYDFATIKYAPDGNQLWVKRYNGPGNSNDSAYALAVDSSGNVYVTGDSTGSGTSYDYATIKYSPDGNQLWVARYNGSGSNPDYAYTLTIDSSGNVYVAGNSYGSGTVLDYATVKYSADGNQIWAARYNGPPGNGSDGVSDLTVDSSGNVYVTGGSDDSNGYDDYATIKYSTDGNQLWVARYNGPGSDNDYAQALAVDDQGNIYVTGYSGGSGTSADYATIIYDPDGSQLRVARYNGPGNGSDGAYALAVDNPGYVYVTGGSYGSGTSNDYATIKYDFSDYSGGLGTEADPYRIAAVSDWQQLMNTSADWNKYFIMTADVNLQGIAVTPVGHYSPVSVSNFTGVFDGNSHIIRNIYMHNLPDSNYVGVFGSVGSGGQIRNLGVEDVNINSPHMNAIACAGGLAGMNKGTISHCYSTGIAGGQSGRNGGLVGYNYGYITDCYATGTVRAFGEDVPQYCPDGGGLVGRNEWGGYISNCYAAGNFVGTECTHLGGLVGGVSFAGVITASFWDVNTSHIETSCGGTGKTTAEMKTLSTFTSAGWDFLGETVNGTEDIWRMCVDGVYYPKLSWQFLQPDFVCPDGVRFEDFAYLAQYWLVTDCGTIDDCNETDMNADDTVNFADIAIFASHWLECDYDFEEDCW